MDIILPTSEQADRFLYEHLLPLIHASQHEKPMVASSGLRFLKLWLESGRKRQDDWCMSLRRYLSQFAFLPSGKECLKVIDVELHRKTLVFGRKAMDTDSLAWTGWDATYIAEGLTALCGYFYNVRPYEFFEEAAPYSSLEMLRSVSTFVSYHVVFSSLEAFQAGPKQGVRVLLKWLEVAEALRSMRNFHMLWAVHNGWHMHQLDRLNLWASLTSSIQKRKSALDALCSVESRFSGLLEEQNRARTSQSGGLIPCVFWFYQKAELLCETPHVSADGSLNTSYFIAAWNIFGSLQELQNMRFQSLKENDASYYFLHLLDSKPFDCIDEETSVMLYRLSDEIKSKPKH
jgi:hypothetical protein